MSKNEILSDIVMIVLKIILEEKCNYLEAHIFVSLRLETEWKGQ
jgi:hypothetical protein